MLKEVLLYIHIAGGFSALLAAITATATKIADANHHWHVYSGRVFCGGMITIFLTAVPLSLLTHNVFLLLVAVFSGYLALSGWSYAKNRMGTPQRRDWLRAYGMLAVSVVMAAYGIHLLLSGESNGLTMLVFSGIGGALSVGDLKIQYAGGIVARERISRHLTMMLAGSIATLTAFVVVNFTFDPPFVLLLAPTLLIAPVIRIWNRKILAGAKPGGMP